MAAITIASVMTDIRFIFESPFRGCVHRSHSDSMTPRVLDWFQKNIAVSRSVKIGAIRGSDFYRFIPPVGR